MNASKPMQSHEVDNLEEDAADPIAALEATGIEMSQSAWWDGLNEWMESCLSKSASLFI